MPCLETSRTAACPAQTAGPGVVPRKVPKSRFVPVQRHDGTCKQNHSSPVIGRKACEHSLSTEFLAGSRHWQLEQ